VKMQKPENYDSTDPKGVTTFENPKAGAHVVKILSAKEVMSKTNRPMLVLCLDMTGGQFDGNYKKMFEYLKKNNSNAKWPCVYRRCTDGGQLQYFKGDIDCIERSNTGYKFNFDESTLVGKVVGCVFGEKEINADRKTILEPRYLCDVEKAKSGEIKPPPLKKYEGGYTQTPTQQDNIDDLPF